MGRGILWIEECGGADDIDIASLRACSKAFVLQTEAKPVHWMMHPKLYRSLRMRNLPYFQYRKQRHNALIPRREK